MALPTEDNLLFSHLGLVISPNVSVKESPLRLSARKVGYLNDNQDPLTAHEHLSIKHLPVYWRYLPADSPFSLFTNNEQFDITKIQIQDEDGAGTLKKAAPKRTSYKRSSDSGPMFDSTNKVSKLGIITRHRNMTIVLDNVIRVSQVTGDQYKLNFENINTKYGDEAAELIYNLFNKYDKDAQASGNEKLHMSDSVVVKNLLDSIPEDAKLTNEGLQEIVKQINQILEGFHKLPEPTQAQQPDSENDDSTPAST